MYFKIFSYYYYYHYYKNYYYYCSYFMVHKNKYKRNKIYEWSEKFVGRCDKLGSHEWHKRKEKINTKTKHDLSSRTCEEQREFIFVSPFVLLLAYAWTMIICLLENHPAYALWRSLCRRLDFIPLFCLLIWPYAYAIVWTRLKHPNICIFNK